MSEQDFLELIEAARGRDQKAQTKLINTFWVDVFSFVMKKVQDENVADELTVSVFSKVLGKLELYDPHFQFKTWVLTIAQNTIIDYWRRKKKESEDVSGGLDQVRNQFARSPEELLISEEEQLRIQEIIESMEVNYREIIRLRFFEEKSIKEISEVLGLSLSNTKVRIMRAKKVLGQLLKEGDSASGV
ncbi:RNA polymerase sigma factor [Bergeyella sp. RCAD1439]|uniref:RNA polymerase sigma factor n=1 Tax=Bergeyella anatis TaxID=3113737 RepID=UPI002E17A125|nr:sigma-70 family RNA polymerase sigma factor [Bergeyella sp. RCAD1439]